MTRFHPTRDTYRPGGTTLASIYYTSAEIYQEELERVFSRSWLCVGRTADLQHHGDYRVVTVGTESVIIVRQDQKQIRAFHNVCRHRGTRLCDGPDGRFRKSIQCPYHGWTYGLDGTLLAAPHMTEVEGFDARDYPLHSVALCEWQGFLFIALAQRSDLGDPPARVLDERLFPYNLSSLTTTRRIEYDVRANWKLIFLNFSECLHCPVIHPDLARLTPYKSGRNDLVEGPVLGGFMTISRQHGSLTKSGEMCGIPLGELPQENRQRVYYYSVFPNMLLSVHPDYVMFHTLWPVGAFQTRIVCEFLFHRDATSSGKFDPSDAVDFWDLTNRQDWQICEASQSGIASRAYTPGPYSPQESLLWAWDQEYLRQIGRTEKA